MSRHIYIVFIVILLTGCHSVQPKTTVSHNIKFQRMSEAQMAELRLCVMRQLWADTQLRLYEEETDINRTEP